MPFDTASLVRRAGTLVLSWAVFACASQGAGETESVQRPRFTLTVKDTFSAAAIPAYQGAHPETYAYIDAQTGKHLANL